MFRRRRREGFKVAPDAQLGLAWYSREAWERLRKIADDREKLDDTYEDWERNALGTIRDLESAGRRVAKVPIDIDTLLAWCRDRHTRLDSAARAQYVTDLLKIAKD